jgi:hypothetical protein
MAEIKKQQLELMDKLNSQKNEMNNMLSHVAEFVPQQQPQGFIPIELNGPLVGQPTTPQVQAPTDDFNDEDKLSLLCLEFN